MSVMDVLSAACLLLGAALALAAGIGLLRFPSVLDRIHAGTKPQIAGVLLVLLGMWLHRPTWQVGGPLLVVALAQFVTVSVAAYITARAAHQSDDETS